MENEILRDGDADLRNSWIESALTRLSNQLNSIVEDMEAEGHRGYLGMMRQAAKWAAELQSAGIAWNEMPQTAPAVPEAKPEGSPSPSSPPLVLVEAAREHCCGDAACHNEDSGVPCAALSSLPVPSQESPAQGSSRNPDGTPFNGIPGKPLSGGKP